MQIAFLGMGIMGSRMAANLIRAGHSLAVWNRTAAKAEVLGRAGAQVSTSPAECVRAGGGAALIFSMLSTPEVVAAAAGEFLSAGKAGALWVDCSTVGPAASRRFAGMAGEHGLRFLDAPVTGSKDAAEQGRLRFFVGGAPEDFAEARPVLEQMGMAVTHMGAAGQGSAIKLVFNMLVGAAMLAYAEGLALGEGLGFSRTQMLDLTLGMPHVAPLVATKRARLESGDFADSDFPLWLLQKDLQLASQAAYEAGVAMPQANAAKEVYRLAMRAGLGEADYAAVVGFLTGR